MRIVMKEHWRSILLYCVSGIMLILLFYMAVDSSTWVDEAYTMGIIRYSIPELISVTAQDVHPPLYYIIVKLIFICTGIEDIYLGVIVARIVSLVPFAIMWILSITYIRRFFGELTGSLFSLCLVTAPQMIATGLEIRMYSWAMLFLLVAFLAVCRLVLVGRREIGTFLVLGSAVLCAFYTHYFAAIAVAILLAIYMVFILIYDRKQLAPFLLMCAVDAILYFPWIMVAFSQIRQVSQDYWIAPIDRTTLIRYFWYAFRIDDSQFGKNVGIILVAVSVLTIGIVIRNRKQKDCLLAFGAMAVMPLTVAAGVVASFLLRPVFVERYLIPTLACFWLGFIFLISKCGRKQYLFTGISVLFLCIGILQYGSNLSDVIENKDEMSVAKELFTSMGNDDIIVHTNLNTEIPVAYYCGESMQYMVEESSTLRIDQIVFNNIKNTCSPEEIGDFLRDGRQVWCLVYPDISILTDEWQQMIEQGEYIGDYFLDWCQFEVYMWN